MGVNIMEALRRVTHAIAKKIPNSLAIEGNMLYLAKDFVPISEGVEIQVGSGGGGGSGFISLSNKLPSTKITAALGSSVKLIFAYASSEDEEAGGIAYVYVNSISKGTFDINRGINEIEIGEFLGAGINEVKLTCIDAYSNSKSLSYSVNLIDLRITSTFDDSQVYSGDIAVRYVPIGAIEKTVHIIVDGKDNTTTTSETGKQQSYTIPAMSHGTHTLKMYITADINGSSIESNELVFDILCVETGKTDPMISSAYNVKSIVRGENVSIGYTVYDPANMETNIKLIIKNGDEIYSTSNRIVDRTRQIWNTRDYPVGENISFIIEYGVVSKEHIITVEESNINISIKETDLEFQLRSAGKSNEDEDRDVWSNGDVTTTFQKLNWASNGWIVDDSGDVALRLSGDAKAIINFQPFRTDARQTGRTIEFIFAIRDVNDRKAVAISCIDDKGIGFYTTADTSSISSEQSTVECNYADEEKIYVTYVIEPRSENRMLSVYLNGILSGVKQYSDTDNFQQVVPQSIEIGSPYCCVDLYSIRSYNTALTADEVKDNYIADITDIVTKSAIYQDNDIYDVYGKISFDKVKNKIPVFLITGELPTYKGDKKKVTVSFEHPEKSILNYEDTATLDVQGTSSQFYIRKNYKSKTSTYHMIDIDKIDTNVICIKVDYAESTGCRNIGGANYVHTLYMDNKVPPQEADDRVRTTIYGYPCCVFWKADNNSTPKFISKGNYNYDKGSEEAFGFTSEYPDAFSVEFCNNTSDPCLFHGEISDSWEDDFEFRYPDKWNDISDFKRMHDWVVSTYQEAATNTMLGSAYTGVDGDTYTHDTAQYRLAKFKKEFTDYFDMDFALVYYTYGLLGMYVDSFAKNLFLTTFDRQHWYCYYYDLDTSWAINNEGVAQFSYDHLFNDKLGNAFIFNGQSSTLWTNFAQAFMDKIKDTYKTWRSNGLVTYDKIIEYFITRQTSRYSASIYNEDSAYKYVLPLIENGDASNLYQVRGSGESHMRYIVKNRLKFFDSYCNAGDYPDDYISLRIYTPTGDLVVAPSANITVTPFSSMFTGVKYKANGTLMQQRTEAGVPVTFIAPDETFNDTETAIYGASELSSVGDLSPLYCGTINVSKATKLTEIIVGNGTDGYSNTNLRDLAVGANKLLKKIDIQNCPNLTEPLAISGCPNIEEIYAQGSGITSVELPESGYLKKCYLPETLTNLTVTNQQYIEEFDLEGYDALTTLRIENTVNIPVEAIMLNAPNLNRVRIIDVSWNAESEAALVQTINKFKSCLGLDANGNNTDKAVVTGRVKVAESVSLSVLSDIYDNFPDLVVDDGRSEIYIINYKDWDGTILYSTRLAEGANAIDPIVEGFISTPTRPSTENYKYLFKGWSTLPTNVNKNYVITAQYYTQYAIKFCVDSTIIYTQYVNAGEAAIDPVETGIIDAPTKAGTDDLHYTFSGWDNLPTNVQSATSVYAQFTNVYPVRFFSDSDLATLVYTQWVVEGNDTTDPVANGDIEAPTKTGTEDMHYGFLKWNSLPTNITAITNVYAIYTSIWAVRFYNDSVVVNTQWIANGGSAVDPVEAGYIETPTRTSTAQYDYTFTGWEGTYTNITSATIIKAKYSSTIRRYNVYFYNGDELLQTIENVQYGSSATYTGSTPVKTGVDNPEDYEFKRFNPEPINITGETECYALFKFTGYIQDSWTTIGENVANGTASSVYQIGARKEIPITLSDGTTTTADVEIIAFNHDDLADGSGKAAITFFCKDLPNILKGMNSASNADGGWQSSEIRTFINGELMDTFPSELKSLIKPVYKISDGGAGNKALITTTDSCWLASYDEVAFTSNSNSLSGQGEAYSSVFYGDKESRKKYIVDDTETGGWWLRSTYYTTSSNTMFWRVQKSGSSYGDIQTGLFYVSFGFCI